MKRRTIVAAISTLVVIILLFNQYTPSKIESPLAVDQIPIGDFFFENVSLKYFDPEGQLVNQLTAKKMEHFKQTQSSLLNEPKILINQSSQSYWHISANNGNFNHTQNIIKMTDDVNINQVESKLGESKLGESKLDENKLTSKLNKPIQTQITAQITTQQLIFNMQDNTAQTDTKVVIMVQENKTQANAMLMNFKTEELQLSGQVESKGAIN